MEEDDGYILISESDVSSWVVGMRVPYPFTHPRYDPKKISTISRKYSGPSPLFPATSSSSASTHRLPTFKPTSVSTSTSSSNSLKRFQEMEEMLSNFDYYRYSHAYGAFEKCLQNPSSQDASGNCNLTEFIELEKMKHFNKFKFYEELISGGTDPHPSSSSPALESNTIGLLVVAGIFGGIFVSTVLILFGIFYLNSLNKTPLTFSEILKRFILTPQDLTTSETDTTASSFLSQHQLQFKSPRHHHNLEIFHEEELGRGSNGTVVLRGLFEGRRHVAVKKMVARFHNFERFQSLLTASLTIPLIRERSILSAADGHSNVVRYIQSIQEGDFYLLVLELCNMSLWFGPHSLFYIPHFLSYLRLGTTYITIAVGPHSTLLPLLPVSILSLIKSKPNLLCSRYHSQPSPRLPCHTYLTMLDCFWCCPSSLQEHYPSRYQTTKYLALK